MPHFEIERANGKNKCKQTARTYKKDREKKTFTSCSTLETTRKVITTFRFAVFVQEARLART